MKKEIDTNDTLGSEIKDTPNDTISSLKFSLIDNFLLATSWDNKIYIYNKDNSDSHTEPFELLATQIFANPQLDCCFEGNDCNYFFSVGLDNDLKRINLELLSNTIIGSHDSAISKVIYDSESKCVFTCGWDEKIKIWDPRNIGNDSNVFNFNSELNISSMIITKGRNLVIAGIDETNTNIIKVYDIRNLANKELVEVSSYETPLKYQTSALSGIGMKDHDGFIVGSIEGKIAVELFENLNTNNNDNTDNTNIIPHKKNYAFKCHREETETKTLVYAVNSIAFLQNLNVFFSAGSDRYIFGWDNEKRKKTYRSPQYPFKITSISLNYNGSLLAIASSENYENLNFPKEEDGILDNSNKHKIFIKKIDNL